MSDHSSTLPRESVDRNSLHKSGDHLNLLDVALDLGQAALYSGIQAPVTGVAQLVDQVAGTKIASATAILPAPREAEFGSIDWHAQQIGGAIGMVAPFFLIHKGVGAVAADSAIMCRPIVSAATSGFLYGTVFQPSNNPDNFWTSRLKQGVVGGVTFGALAGTGALLNSAAESGLVRNSLPLSMFGSSASNGIFSGATAGLVGAEVESLINDKGIASGNDLVKSAYGYAMVGGLFGAAQGFDYSPRVTAEPFKPTLSDELQRRSVYPENLPEVNRDGGIDVVLGAGGMRGFGLLGFLRYLEDKQVKVGKVTGVSIGGIVGALHTNGYSARQIEDIMKYELDSSCLKSLTQTHQFLRHPWRALSSHFVDTRPTMEDFVNKYQLKPQENLRLVSLNVLTWSPVVFEGTNYNLAQALAASSAIPGAMRPVWYKPPTNGYVPESMSHRGILVDGGAYRMTPSEFTDGHALIASISSPESLDGIETLKHLPQIMRPAILKALKTPYIESPGPDDLLVPVGKAEIDTLDFNLPNHQISALIDHGYTQAEANLDQHIAGGKIPILPLEQPAQIRPRARKPFAWRALFPAQAAS